MTAVFCTAELERKFSNDRHRTRVAGEHRLWIVEVCIPRRQIVQVTTGNGIETSHVVYAKSRAGVAARNVLSMVEDIAELRTQTKFEPLGNVYVLIGAKVQIVGWPGGQSIAAAGGQRTRSGYDVLGAGVVRQVSYNIASRVRQSGDVASRTRNSTRVEDSPIAGAIVVQVRIRGGLHVGPLRRLVGVNRAKCPVPYDVLHEPITTLEERQIVNSRQGKAVRAGKRRDGSVGADVLKILRTTGSKAGGEEIRRTVVDRAAVSVRRLEGQAIAEASLERSLQPVVVGTAERQISGDVAGKTCTGILRKEAAPGLQAAYAKRVGGVRNA